MRLAHSLVRALFAWETHEKLALDALPRLAVPQGSAFHRMLLARFRLYLDGATAPDRAIGDFENHIVHPRDNYWGGAPRKAEAWYRNLVDALAREDWDTAAYCAGIMGHYATDPLHPFNTAQTEAENAIHAAVNWSINHAYDDLFDRWAPIPSGGRCIAGTSANWVALLVCEGADHANVFYEKLIAHYDINRAIADPVSGLDPIGRRIVGSLLMRAQGMVATLLDRALVEARVQIPDVALGSVVRTSLAQWPTARWARIQRERTKRFEIEDIYQELRLTGTVRLHLPKSEQVVRDAYARDVTARKQALVPSNIFPFNPRPEVVTRIERDRIQEARLTGRRGAGDVVDLSKLARRPDAAARIAAHPHLTFETADNAARAAEDARAADLLLQKIEQDTRAAAQARARQEDADAAARDSAARLATAALLAQNSLSALSLQSMSAASQVAPNSSALHTSNADNALVEADDDDDDLHSDLDADDDGPITAGQRRSSGGRTSATRIYLTLDRDIVDAPSIGPKMAERFRAVGVDTVGEFLSSHPLALSARLATRRLTPELLTAWQDQARLVCSVPGLRGTHAQLLVGAGIRSAEALAAIDADRMCSQVLQFALTKEGQRILREGKVPDTIRIKSWAENAKAALAA